MTYIHVVLCNPITYKQFNVLQKNAEILTSCLELNEQQSERFFNNTTT